MLCPEVWYFKAPESTLKCERGELSQNNCLENIKKNYYNHLVSVVVPDTLCTPESLCDLLITDCEYYKISNLSLNELIEKDFISNFIKKGSFTALSINTRIDCDDCISVTPDGVIVLSLTKDSYQSLGLDGSVSHFYQNTKGRYKPLEFVTPNQYNKCVAASLCSFELSKKHFLYRPYCTLKYETIY